MNLKHEIVIIGKAFNSYQQSILNSILHKNNIIQYQFLNLDEIHKIKEINPKIILALGEEGLKITTGKKGIKKWRGSILPMLSNPSLKVIPTYHPEAMVKMWSLGVIINYDVKKAIIEKNNYTLQKIRNLIISPSYIDTITFLEIASKKQAITYDIETSPSNITCIGIGIDGINAISIPTTKYYWGNSQKLKDVLMHINWVLTMPTLIKIGQNISFDIQYLFRIFGILPTKPWADTMLMQHACYSELPKGLAFLTSIYTNETYYKDDLKTWFIEKTNDEMLWTYNAKDCVITYEVYNKLIEEMNHLKVTHTYNFMLDLLEPLIYMMLRGLKIDDKAIAELKSILDGKINEKESSISKQTSGVNLNSPKQLMSLAYDTMKLKPIISKGKISMNAKALSKLAVKNDFFADIAELRKDKKLLSTYLNTPLDGIDNRLKCSFNSTGTETGRLSSSKSVFGSGTNLQNFPKHIRNIVVPESGMMFTEADLKGAEAMVVAYLSQDSLLIELFKNDGNIHNYTAHLIWGVSDEEIKQDKDLCSSKNKETDSMYYKAKRVRHSGNYMASWMSLQEQLNIPAAEAKKLLQKFYDTSPSLVNWHNKIKHELEATRILTTPMGRKRIFFDRMSQSLLREAVAYIPQETVAHVLNLGLINVYNTLCQDKHIELLLQVHDSILLQHPIEMKDYIHQQLQQLMSIPITYYDKTFSIPIEIKSGLNWRDLK